jgi:hypothetical protein
MGKKLKEFQEEMHWNNEDLIAQFHWAMCVEAQACAEAEELEKEDYDHYLSCVEDAMWVTKNS